MFVSESARSLSAFFLSKTTVPHLFQLTEMRSFPLLICLFPISLFAQNIDQTAAFRNVNSDRYFRFHYDNDYFTATDYYYTQGINLELVLPVLKKNPLTKALIHLKNSPMRYGLSVEQNGFTPTSISHNEILYGDRPFAADLMLKTFSITTDTVHAARLTTTLSLGIIGQAAFGEAEQTAIHRWLKNITPLGWQNQIRNDVIVNYEVGFDKQLYRFRDLFALDANAQLRLGTLSDKAQIGFTMTAGKFESPFSTMNYGMKNRFQLYFYNQVLANFIAYDATLQGGMFNRSSPYTVSGDELSRLILQDNFGVVLHFRKIHLEYHQSIVSKAFQTGRFHRWGGVSLGLLF